MKQAEQEAICGQVKIGQFLFAERLEQRVDVLEGLFGFAARGVTRNGLDHGTRRPPMWTIDIHDFADSELNLGRHLFRLGKIVLSTKGQAFAFDRSNTLIAFGVILRIEGHDEGPLAEQGQGPQALETAGIGFFQCGQLFFVEPAETAKSPTCVIIGHNIAHSSRALRLQN